MRENIRKFIRKRDVKAIIFNITMIIYKSFSQVYKSFSQAKTRILYERYSLVTKFTKSPFKKNHFFTTHNNAVIIGNSRLILSDDQGVFGHISNNKDMHILRTYYLLEELNGHIKLKKDFKVIEIKNHSLNKISNLTGLWLHLTSSSSNNYMHFISEQAPQLVSFIKNNKELHFGIIVDANLPKQILEFIDLVSPNIPRIEIYPAQRLKIEKLAKINKQGYCFAWGRKTPNILMGYKFIKEDLIKLRSYIFSHYKPTNTYKHKLFIKRKSTFRNLLNEVELSKIAIKKNFFVIEPGSMPFCEQVNFYNSASVVFCQGGSSLANMIFMKPGSKVMCAVIEGDCIDYDYFKNYGSIFNVSVEYLFGAFDTKKYNKRAIYSKEHPYNADFSLDVGLFLEALSRI
jgi:hypothetical protein